jgi:hypothetical protein
VHALTEAPTASEQAQNRRSGSLRSRRRFDARFGTLLLRVRALAEGPNASEQALSRRKTVRQNMTATSLQGFVPFHSA